MYYVNYNRYGQNIGHNSVVPHDIHVDGTSVVFSGEMSRKTFDQINEADLVSHHVIGETPQRLYCYSQSGAEQVAELLRSNPNYSRNGA